MSGYIIETLSIPKASNTSRFWIENDILYRSYKPYVAKIDCVNSSNGVAFPLPYKAMVIGKVTNFGVKSTKDEAGFTEFVCAAHLRLLQDSFKCSLSSNGVKN